MEFAGIHKGYMEEEFYGKMFRDSEYSHVYVYREPVDIQGLKLQEEEVESVMWMELDACMESVGQGTLPNCLYMDELELLKQYLGAGQGD